MDNRKLIEFRKSLNFTQDDMASKLKLSTSFYSKIEMGERNPSFNFLKRLKDTFPSVDIVDIFFNHRLHKECMNADNTQVS